MNAMTMQLTGRAAKQYRTRNVPEAVGMVRRASGIKAERMTAILGHSATQESRIRSGERLSPMGHAAVAIYEAVTSEACPLEAAGYCSAFIEITLRSVAMWPELEKLSTAELRVELGREISRRETRANGVCNNLDSDFLNDGALNVDAMLEAHTAQATSSTRIVAILQVLSQREG